MKLGIIGSGRVGYGLGVVLKDAGHEVVYGVRAPGDTKLPAGETVLSIEEAMARADVILLATPASATAEISKTAKDVTGKIIVDATNDMKGSGDSLHLPRETQSVGEKTAALFEGALVYKTFNQIGSEVLENAKAYRDGPLLMVFAGPDKTEPKKTVAQLIGDAGFEAHYAGGIEHSLLLEALGVLWTRLAELDGLGRRWGLRSIQRP